MKHIPGCYQTGGRVSQIHSQSESLLIDLMLEEPASIAVDDGQGEKPE
jgi:hypothetical protein